MHLCFELVSHMEHQIIEEAGKAYYSNINIKGKSLVVPRIMFDNGACRHMWGKDLVEAGLVHNIREVEPHNLG